MAGLTPGFSLAETGKKGGTPNTILSPEPPVLVLAVNNQGPTIIAASKIFQGLLCFSPKLGPVPCLAKSWALSDDRKTYTFHLQPGVTFHDGSPFTADDVIFSIMKFNMELSPRARSILQLIAEATTPDPLTVKLTLSQPFEPFLLMFDVSACVMVSKKAYEGTDYRNAPANQHPIGTGPFQFTEWQRGNFIRMTRYEKYWKPDEPYLDEIIYHIVPDSQSRSLALETGKVQLTGASDIEPFDVPRFRAKPNLTVSTAGWEYFGMNTVDAHFRGMAAVWDTAHYLVLPALTLGLFYTAVYARLTRTSMLEVADQDFVKTARAKGAGERRILWRHVLRNALLPIITFAGIQAGQLVGGSILVETVFAWPGIGRLAFDALLARDYALLLGVFFITSMLVIVFNLLTDLLYLVVDPRVEAG
jgi:ABC-type transport system substrate-binding protein